MMATLEDQVSAFNAQLSQIRQAYGSTWAVFLGEVKGHFDSFDEAIDFAFERYSDQDFLVKHTYEKPEFVPYILVD